MYQALLSHCKIASFPLHKCVRYWIWWNELVQGPFEVSELSALSAFTEDLPVCMEGRADWVPASRMADLAPAIEALRAKSYLPASFGAPAPPAPPPPPARPPRLVPLQGDFFNSAAEQEFLFEPPGENKSHFDFLPVLDATTAEQTEVDVTPLPVTAPIRFTREAQFRISGFVAKPGEIITQSRFIPAVEPIDEPSVVEFTPEPMRETISEPEPFYTQEPIAAERHQPDLPELPRIVTQSPLPMPEPEPVWKPKIDLDVLPTEGESSRRLWPWLLGTAAMMGLLFGGGYWLFDYKTTQDAISAVKPYLRVPVAHKPAKVVPKQDPLPHPMVEPKPEPPKPPMAVTKPVVKKSPPVTKKVEPKIEKPVVIEKIPVVPGMSTTPEPTPAPVPESVKATPVTPDKPDPWKDRQNEAIERVMKYRIAGGKLAVADHAKLMLDQMHDKELLHAAETGERLYLPDKMGWSALREDGAVYRVYLNYSALQADGQRAQARSYQFSYDLQHSKFSTDDSGTRQDFLALTQPVIYKRVDLAKDIDNLLSGVDAFNKQKLRAMIVKNGKNKKEAKSTEAAVQQAREKVRKSIVYFRTKYPETALQNIGKAYSFVELLK